MRKTLSQLGFKVINADSVALYITQLFSGLSFMRWIIYRRIAGLALSGNCSICRIGSACIKSLAVPVAPNPLHSANSYSYFLLDCLHAFIPKIESFTRTDRIADLWVGIATYYNPFALYGNIAHRN